MHIQRKLETGVARNGKNSFADVEKKVLACRLDALTPPRTAPADLEFQKQLLARADRLRRHVEARIPAEFKGVLSANDILQEVWISVFKAGRGQAPKRTDELERWLLAITNRKLLDVLRTQRAVKRGGRARFIKHADKETRSLVGLFNQLASGRCTPSGEVAVQEAVSAVRLAIGSLEEGQRRAVWLRHIEGRSYDEIAEAMNRSIPAVRGLLSRGLVELRGKLVHAARFFSDAGT